MNQKKILLFDIDGTLCVNDGVTRGCFEEVFLRHFGVENSRQGINAHGKTDQGILDEVAESVLGRKLAVEEVEKFNLEFVSSVSNLFENELRGPRILPGIRELLEVLSRKEELLLGLQTGNMEVIAKSKLDYIGIWGYFSFGGFASDAYARKDLVQIAIDRGVKLGGNPSKVLLIGDTLHDIRAAKDVGAKVVAVATGGTSAYELGREEPDFLFEDLSDRGLFVEILEKCF